jgi:predicted dehydrogenase
MRHKVSVLGLGAMGARHARVLASLPDRFELVAVYDPRAEAPGPPGPPRVASEAEAIARADLVVVASPTHAHAGTLARALAAGRHVLVEKPLCPTSAEADALATAFARSPAKLFVGHSERFNPVVRALARLLRSDRVLAIDLHRAGPSRTTDGNVLVNLGVHDFDLAAYLAGRGLILRAALGDGDFAHVLFDTGGGAVGHAYVDGSAPAKRRTIAIRTPRWTYDGDLLRPRLLRAPAGRSSVAPFGVGAPKDKQGQTPWREVPLPLEEPLRAQASALADALDAADDPAPFGAGAPKDKPGTDIATGVDGARSVDIAERAAAACAANADSSGGAAEKLSVFARP